MTQSQPRVSFSAWCYVLAWAGSLFGQVAGVPACGTLAGLAMLTFLIVEFPRQRRYAQVLFLVLSAIGLIGVATVDDRLSHFLAGWQRGAVYGGFFLALSSLRDAAETSPLVRRCGQHLVAQPPGRRYAALTGGGHLFGIILSYGAIDLLGAMVTRANALSAAAGWEAARVLRARRMLMAIHRGFCVMNCWNPLNLMTVIVTTAVPGAPMRALIPAALLVSVALMVLGWAEDRMAAARSATRDGVPPNTRESWSIHLRMVALVLGVMVLAEAASLMLHISLAAAVTLAVPPVALIWAVLQSRGYIARFRGPGGRTVDRGMGGRVVGIMRRRTLRFLHRVPNFRAEATVLAASGFMGVSVGAALPATGMEPLLAWLPPITIPLLVPVVLIATGQIGLNPIAVVALLGAIIPDPLALGVSPAVLAFSCMLGWGLAVNMTPMSASAIITARWAGVSPWTVTTRWNLAYSLSALLLGWGAVAVMFVVWG